MKKTTVLFVDHAPIMGGAERSLLLLIKGLDKTRFNVVLACPAETELALEASNAGAKVVDLFLARLRGIKNPFTVVGRLLTGLWQLRETVKEEKADIVHSNVMRASIYACIAARLAGAKYVWHVRDIHSETLYKLLFSYLADRIVAISLAVRNSLPKQAWDKTQVIYNAIDLSRFDSGEIDSDSFRRSIGVTADALLIGNVGWIAPWKRIDLFIDAVAGLGDRLADARFVIVGASADERYNEYFEQLKKHSDDTVGDRIIWAGARENMAEVMASLDVLVHTAEDEPFGRVIIEAMAMGKPVIAPNSGGPAEIVDDGHTGLLFESGDVGSLETTIVELMEVPEYAQSLGKAGAVRVRELFALDSQIKAIENLYKQMVGIKSDEEVTVER